MYGARAGERDGRGVRRHLYAPDSRDLQRVLADGRNGLVSREAAEQIYRVAIEKDRWKG